MRCVCQQWMAGSVRPGRRTVLCTTVLCAGACVSALAGGCGFTLLGGVPPELTPGLGALLEDAARFAQSAELPLAGVAAGTERDAIGDLTGCWGAYSVAGPQLLSAQWLEFDAAAGTLVRQTWERIGALATVVFVQEGAFAVVDESTLRFTVQRILTNDFLSGELEDVTERYGSLPVYDVAITRLGDAIKLRFSLPADDPRTPAGFLDDSELVHVAADCP